MALRDRRHQFRIFAGSRPWLFYNLWKLKPKNQYNVEFAITCESEFVIEAFPRSGNTFASFAFLHAQPEKVKLAHHLHIPAQIALAARWGIPALVIIRNPHDAVASYLMRHPELRPSRCIQEYIIFYESLFALSDQYVIATFEEVTADFGKVMETCNQRFGTTFRPFKHDDENVNQVFAWIDKVNDEGGEGKVHQLARPSSEKAAEKNKLEVVLGTPECRELIDRATCVYTKFLSLQTLTTN